MSKSPAEDKLLGLEIYAGLLQEELESVIAFMHAHGWRSARIVEGEAIRQEYSIVPEHLKTALAEWRKERE
jgi:hypothetical protein